MKRILMSTVAERIKPLAKIEVIASKENHSFENDLYYEEEVKQAFREMVKQYGIWGWCSIEVKVTYRNFTASDFLGGCSYPGKVGFVKSPDYYEMMVAICLEKIGLQVMESLNEAKAITSELASKK